MDVRDPMDMGGCGLHGALGSTQALLQWVSSGPKGGRREHGPLQTGHRGLCSLWTKQLLISN